MKIITKRYIIKYMLVQSMLVNDLSDCILLDCCCFVNFLPSLVHFPVETGMFSTHRKMIN